MECPAYKHKNIYGTMELNVYFAAKWSCRKHAAVLCGKESQPAD